jgi:tetratricopeptide (TPR) repeat protein
LSYEPDNLVRRYVKENQVPYIVGAGAKATEKAYGIKDYPTMFIIDPDGNVAWSGHPGDEKVTKTIDALLKDNPPKAKAKLGDKAAKDALKKADALLKKKKYAEALKAYEKVAKNFKDSKSAKKARTAIDKLRADAKIMAQVRTDELKKECENWLEMARSLAKSGDQKAAADYYDRIIDKYPDSKYAETAAEEKAKLRV